MSLAAPGTNPASNLELKLPHTIGSANQLLKVDANGQLGWATDSTTDSTKLPLAGGTLTGNLTAVKFLSSKSSGAGLSFADSVEINLGTGDDLKLWHQTGNSYITSTGANLTLRAAGHLYLQDIDGNTMADFNDGGAVELYHNGNKAAATASDDFDVYRRLRIKSARDMSGDGIYLGEWDGSNHRIEGDSSRPIFITAYNSSGIKFGYQSGEKVQIDNSGLKIVLGGYLDFYSGRTTYRHTGSYGEFKNNTGDLYCAAAGNLKFYTDTSFSTERLRIKTDGDIEVGGNLKTNNLSGRNLLINGDFSVWQRGSSFNIAAPIYTADRWNTYGASTSQMTISRESFNVGQTDVTDNPKYMLRMSNVPDADSTWMQMYQRIEDVTQFSNTQLTISFWIRTNNATNNYYWQFVQRFGTGGSTAVSTNTSTFNTTTSWVKHTFTVTVPSISGKTVGTGNNLEVHFLNNSTTGNDTYIDFANIQVEKGTIATSFERRSYQEELAKCQRYFAVYHPTSQERIYIEGSSTNHRWWEHPIPAGMRTEPSIAKGGTCSSLSISMAGSLTINGLAVTGVDNGGSGGTLHPGSMGNVSYRVSTTGTGGSQYSVRHTDGWENGAGWITMDAEL